MFYSVQLLGKTSPLGKLWAAAYDNRLRRQDINDTSVSRSVEHILDPSLPLSLRLSGLLLLGLVKIYSRQLQYLRDDCNTSIGKLDKADKDTAAAAAAHSKAPKAGAQGGGAGPASTANPADITLQNAGEMMFAFHSMSQEEGFGLFDENNSSSLALAAEAHESFMDVDISGLMGSQGGLNDDDLMGALERQDSEYSEPERLRDGSMGEPSGNENDMLPLLNFGGDALPPVTPVKQRMPRRSGSAPASGTSLPSKDASVGGDHDDQAGSPMAGAVPHGVDYDELPPAEAMDELPELGLPDTAFDVPPEDDEALPPGDEPMHFPVGSRERSVGEGGDEADQDDAATAGAATPAADAAGAPAQDEEPGCGPTPAPDEAYQPPPDTTTPADTPKPAARPRKAKPAAKARVKPTLGRDKGSAKLPQAQMRDLLRDRSPLLLRLPPLCDLGRSEGPRGQEVDRMELDLDDLMMPEALSCAVLDPALRRLFTAVARCEPLADERDGKAEEEGGEDASEQQQRRSGAAPRRRKRGRAALADGDHEEEDHIEEENDAGAAAGAAATPGAGDVDTPEVLRRRSEGGLGEDADAALPSLGAPSEHSDSALHVDRDAGPPDFDPAHDADMPLPDADMPLPDLPELGPHEGEIEDGTLPAVSENPTAGVPGESGDEGDGPSRHERFVSAGTAGGEGGTSQSQSQGESSLSMHTLATLQRIEDQSQATIQGSRKRKASSTQVALSQLLPACTRSEAAKTFYDVLVLYKESLIDIEPQEEMFADIHIHPSGDKQVPGSSA